MWTAEGTDRGAAQLDLSLSVIDEPGGFRASIEYAADLFDAATIDRFADHLGRLLEGIAADPDRAIADLPILSVEERAQLLAWNDTAAPVPSDLLVHDLFLEQAERTPNAIAVEVAGRPEERLTYAELRDRAGRIAGGLRAPGAGPGTIVGLSTGRSLDMAAGLLGILEAGAAYLPLDPTYPADRLAFMRGGLGRGPRAHGEAAGRGMRRTGHGPLPDDLAYVIYTSGSTGRPKGVMVPHRSVVNHAFAIRDLYELGGRPRPPVRLAVVRRGGGGAVSPLLAGGCVVLWPEAARSGVAEFHRRERGDHRFRLVVLHLASGSRRLIAGLALPSLRLVVTGGEQVRRTTSLEGSRGPIRLLNALRPEGDHH